ncbi:hypothetical protein MAPG_01828 [Magnaporthiopsis poae ATCC 64411]|uniref:Cell wall protein n=1 Tax=Magnaporthiopsis poae (strain ATCC 64411 / 73-15) TaxID=644358 RepID=A0A0C4DPQ7_MAGP6|nr:hypothetical protein MAPG_01828 [Magnaporthiopsis poae ATCC 64411]
MKPSIPAIFTLAMGASASAVAPRAAVEARSLEVVMRVMTNVYENMVRLDGAITRFQAIHDVEELKQHGGEMVTTIQSADAEVLGMTPITLEEAAQFQPLSEKLNVMGAALLGHAVEKTPTFGQAGVCSYAQEMISRIGANVIKLMGDVAAKFPTDVQGEGNQGIQRFANLFAETVARLNACASSSGQTTSSGPTTPFPIYPKPNSTAAVWSPTPTGTRPPVIFTAGAALNGVATGAVALMAAAYFL